MAELEGYYCGLCGRLMPISHFPHSEQKVATMTEIHPDFGELYPYSDHTRGDHVTYRVDGLEETGEIIWVSVAHTLPSGRDMPPHYWIVRDGGGFPDAVLFSDIVIVEEVTMEYCKYCRGMHPKGTLDQCPLYNPDR